MTARLTKPGHRHRMTATIETREDLNGTGKQVPKIQDRRRRPITEGRTETRTANRIRETETDNRRTDNKRTETRTDDRRAGTGIDNRDGNRLQNRTGTDNRRELTTEN
jgi:hypothetical protein